MLIGFAHALLNGSPTNTAKGFKPIFWRRCFYNWEICLIGQLVKVKVPPTPIIKLHFGVRVSAFNLIVIPLVSPITGYTCELTQVKTDLNSRQVAHGAVITKGCTARIRCLGIEWEITCLLEEWALIQINTGITLKQVCSINKISHTRHPIVRAFSPATISITPR